MADHQKFNLKTLDELRALALELKLDIPISEDLSILFKPLDIEGQTIVNRLVVQPMEGFDSLPDGSPGELTTRRYERYARGGSGMIWYEATSVMNDGRSNPRQLMLTRKSLDGFKSLVENTRKTAIETHGQNIIPYQVLQLTHSGRYSKPEGKPTGRYYTKNDALDQLGKYTHRIEDDELELIRDKYYEAIKLAEEAGFDSVDLKISHGYLLHEIMLGFNQMDSRYGGSFENRLSFIKEVISLPSKLTRSIRLNATDLIPYPNGFGMMKDGSNELDLSEPLSLVRELEEDVPLWNITAGIPYYNSFVNRPHDRSLKGAPAPPEHPLEGVVRLIKLTDKFQKEFPGLPMVGSAYSWLRQFFPYVAAGVLEQNQASLIGLGRSAFAYPDAPVDLMRNGVLNPKKVCVTCSNCTQLMRNNSPSGCTVRDRELYRL